MTLKLFTLSIILMCSVSMGVLLNFLPVSAVSANDWKAGNIIGNNEFTNQNSMSVQQIQAWLDTRLKNCDPSGIQISELGGPDYNKDGRVTRAEYGKSIGNPAPFTCLNKYYEVPKIAPKSGYPQSNYGLSSVPKGAKSAAQLIYDAGNRYSINPKVLLVKLGTESAGPLTSDTWPLKSQYLYAMGARCPDSGPGGSANCDSSYAGFSIQMMEAAKLLRGYLDDMDQPWWPYKKQGQVNHVLWNVVERGCGGKDVYIENKATAALYTYTPYQPNSAALNNMYGTGDNCSAYGNRNFWRVYNDWFGSAGDTPFFRIGNGSSVYIDGVNNTYYKVLNRETLLAYGWGKTIGSVASKNSSYISKKQFEGNLPLTARFETDSIYAIDKGIKHAYTGRSVLNKYGLYVGDEAKLPKETASYFSEHTPMRNIAVDDNHRVYLINDAKKRHFNGPSAYKSGKPSYASLPGTGLSNYFLSTIPNGAKIYTPGDTLRVGTLPAVYMVLDANRKISIPNRNTMASFGLSFQSVNSITASESEFYSTEPKVLSPIIRSDSNENDLYIVGINGSVYTVSQEVVESSYKFITSNVIDMPQSVINQLRNNGPITKLVRAEGENAVYIVNNGIKKPISSRKELKNLGYSMDDVSNISKIFSDIIPVE